MNVKKTKEPQNQIQIDNYLEHGPARMGPWTTHIWKTDPRHLCFLLARYKFCAKMLPPGSRALEIGCGDAFGIPIVLQTVKHVQGIDFEPLIIEEARERLAGEGFTGFSLDVHDITESPLTKRFDCAYSLDVIEHIEPEKEDAFMTHIAASLNPQAVLILGTPNITAQNHASAASREGHINLKSAQSLEALMHRYFHNAFLFSMNDEVVHTGYAPMAHYLLAMGVGVKDE